MEQTLTDFPILLGGLEMAAPVRTSRIREEADAIAARLGKLRETAASASRLLTRVDEALAALVGPESPLRALLDVEPMVVLAEATIQPGDMTAVGRSPQIWGAAERLRAYLQCVARAYAENETMTRIARGAFAVLGDPASPVQEVADYIRVLDRLSRGDTSPALVDQEFGWASERTDRAFAFLQESGVSQEVKPEPAYVLTEKGKKAARRLRR